MDEANSAIKVVNSLWEQLTHAPSHLLSLVVLIFLGMLVKKSPTPNWTIPWLLIAVGVVVYPLLASPANIDPSFPRPEFVLRLYGGLLGVGAIVGHGILKRFAWFQRIETAFTSSYEEKLSVENENKENT